MSLAIDTGDVTSVLLADGWHPVIDESFKAGAYLYREGHVEHAVPHEPFSFTFLTTPAVRISGPLSSVLAVQTEP